MPHGARPPHGRRVVTRRMTITMPSRRPPGSRAAELVTTLFLFVAMVLSWIAF